SNNCKPAVSISVIPERFTAIGPDAMATPRASWSRASAASITVSAPSMRIFIRSLSGLRKIGMAGSGSDQFGNRVEQHRRLEGFDDPGFGAGGFSFLFLLV